MVKDASTYSSSPSVFVPWPSTNSNSNREKNSWNASQRGSGRGSLPLKRANRRAATTKLSTVTPLLEADPARNRRATQVADDGWGGSTGTAGHGSRKGSRERGAGLPPSGYEAISSADPLSAEELLGAISALGAHHEEEPKAEQLAGWRSAGEKVLSSLWFQACMAGFIVLNAIIIGVETDNPEAIPAGTELTFLIVFALEVVARLVVFSPAQFFDHTSVDFKWNAFDLLIVCLGVFDETSAVVAPNMGAGGYMTVFRILRLMRILRVFRIIRFLRQLYSLAIGFVLSTTAVFWVTFLMTFVLYVSAIVLVRTLGRTDPSDVHYELFHSRFGTVFQAMETLFQLMAVPDLDPYHDVLNEMPFFTAFIFAFTIFGSFGMIAMLTGVISENMFEKNWERAQEEGECRRLKCLLLIQRAEELFSDKDLNEKGEVSRDELVRTLPEIQAIFDEHDVAFAEEDLVGMIEIIDAEGRGSVRREEFRHFIVQMAQGVRPLLIMELYYAIKMVMKKQEHSVTVVDEILELSKRSSLERSYHVTTLTGKLDDHRAHLSEQVSGAQRDVLQQQASSSQGVVEQVALVRTLLAESTAEISRKLDELAARQARAETNASRILSCEASAQESRNLLETMRSSLDGLAADESRNLLETMRSSLDGLATFGTRLDGLAAGSRRPSVEDVTPNELAAKGIFRGGSSGQQVHASSPVNAVPTAEVRHASEAAGPPSSAAPHGGGSPVQESTSHFNTGAPCSSSSSSAVRISSHDSRGCGSERAAEARLGEGGGASSS